MPVHTVLLLPSKIVQTSVAPLGTFVATLIVAEDDVTVDVMWNPSYPYFMSGRTGLVNNFTLPSVALKLKSPAAGAKVLLVVLHRATRMLFVHLWTYSLMSKKNALYPPQCVPTLTLST